VSEREPLAPNDGADTGFDDEVPEDDAIIGKAFRVSGVAIVAIAAVVAAVVWWVSREPELAPAEEVEVLAPRAAVEAPDPPEIAFTDVTRAAGIDFERFNGAAGEKLLPETMGGGVAFLDYDSDGDPDLLLINGAPWDGSEGAPSALYANDGAGRFENRTAEAGLAFTHQGTGAGVGDWDGDGDPDLFLPGVGAERWLRNESGRFEDVSAAVSIPADPERWSTCTAFFDHDRDGDLDLYVGSYVRWSPAIDREVDYQLTGVGRAYGPPTNYPGDHSRLLRNDGAGGFEDVSAAAGIEVVNASSGVAVGKALGAAPVDIDGDGWIDLAVANDTVRNFLFRNRQDGTFEEAGLALGIAYDRNGQATGAMGIDVADYRNEGALGFAIGNFANEMTSLYVAQAEGRVFTDESIVDGVGAPSRRYLSFGLFFFDYDLDGRQDLLQVNGHLEDEIAVVQPSQSYEQPAQLFWNAGPESRSTFVEVQSAGDLLARPLVGRGCAYADIDADGDLDVILTQSSGRPVLLRNEGDTRHHWLAVELAQEGGNRAGIGARIVASSSGRSQVRRLQRSRGYLTQVLPSAHFGLGPSGDPVQLEVTWPDGFVQTVQVDELDRRILIERVGG